MEVHHGRSTKSKGEAKEMSLPEQNVAAAAETVTKAVSTASILSHIKANRIEYIGLVIICHLLGLSDRFLAQVNGVCF